MDFQNISDEYLTKRILNSPLGSFRHITSIEAIPHCEAVRIPAYLVYHVLQGHKHFFSGTEQWLLKEGDSLLIRRDAAVSCEAVLYHEQSFQALSIHFSFESVQKFAQERPHVEVPALTQNACLLQKNASLQGYFKSVGSFFSTDAHLFEELLIHKHHELLMHLFMGLSQQQARIVCAEAFSPRRQAYLKMLKAALKTPMRTEEMALYMHMSLSSFKREFKHLFEQTPARYLMERRLEAAQQLLLTTDKAIRSIAFETGFENVSHFVQTFKRKYGKTPGVYRGDGFERSSV